MCGIFGWATTRPFGSDDLLGPALAAIAHRGPDGEGRWRTVTPGGAEVAFGHRRLSIIDLEGGAQPLFSHDRRFAITYNGEVYNYIELRDELAALGHAVQGASDTEVVIEAYRAWGPACLKRLRGMFAFAIHDAAEDLVFLARDAFGKKPLFLADIAGGVAFSSEIEPLLTLPGVSRAMNMAVLGDYLVSRYAPGPQTFFKDVRKLAPGSYAIWRNGTLSETRYFTPPMANTAPEAISYADAVEQFRQTLDDAVRLRMRSDAPFGAYLSGGLDSSVIVALMARHSGRAVKTFSVGFAQEAYSELSHAARVAKAMATDHEELVVSPAAFEAAWPDAVRHRGAPVSEASDIPILLLSHAARSSVKMVLTGEGADELLAGYPKYGAEAWVQAYHAFLSPELHRRLIDPVVRALPYDFRRLKILSRVLGEREISSRERLWFGSASLDEAAQLMGRAPALLPIEGVSPTLPLSNIRQLQLFDQVSWLPDNLLERGDRMMMGGSIEGRMPFMDTELATLTARFPDSHFTRHPKGKAVLRTVAEDLIDGLTIKRPKVGFRVPVGDWFRGDQKANLLDLLKSGESLTRRMLDPVAIDTLVDQHLSHQSDNEKMLWTLTNLEMFLRTLRPDLP